MIYRIFHMRCTSDGMHVKDVKHLTIHYFKRIDKAKAVSETCLSLLLKHPHVVSQNIRVFLYITWGCL